MQHLRKIRLTTGLGRLMIVVGMLLCIASLGVAFAATSITTPNTSPFLVPGDASGNPLPFTIVAHGFPVNASVLAEQCDGRPSSDKAWDVTTDCDIATSCAAVHADANGDATFPAADLNHQFKPVKDASPEMFFNCLSPNEADPNNGLESWKNCQVRVSTNNSVSTTDQVFLTMTLPDAVAGTTTTTAQGTTTAPTDTTTTTAELPTTTTTGGGTTSSTASTTSTSTSTSTSTTSTSTSTTTSTVPNTTTTHATTTTTHATTTTTHPTTTTTHPTTTTSTAPATTTTHATSTTVDASSTTRVSVEQVTTTTTTIAPVAVVTTGDPGTLPRTGSSSAALIALGISLVVAGLGLVAGGAYVTRRQRYTV